MALTDTSPVVMKKIVKTCDGQPSHADAFPAISVPLGQLAGILLILNTYTIFVRRKSKNYENIRDFLIKVFFLCLNV